MQKLACWFVQAGRFGGMYAGFPRENASTAPLSLCMAIPSSGPSFATMMKDLKTWVVEPATENKNAYAEGTEDDGSLQLALTTAGRECLQLSCMDLQTGRCLCLSLSWIQETNDVWETATLPRRHTLQDPQSLCESSFTAVKLKRKGRTADGHSCDCTDKPKKKADVAASPLNLFGSKEKKGTEQIAKELERERQQAERENADKEMATAFGEFEGAKEHYDKAISEVNSAWKAFLEQQPKYETSFWLLKAMHDSECRKLMEDHNGAMADCHKNWLTAREEYFARARVPQCVQGEEPAFEFQVSPLLSVLAPLLFSAGAQEKSSRLTHFL
ncbi:hypothetical protein AK812_SmicGene28109 [Symbiodinium microadriaticum]|uniref:Uncharacterized protein n=1 Tax=Symbiodinium microadriaticum TaxID=2951 RepID=A0A1Q9D557_SYMMI|nr:hypothetical protein AK812_SmicGene28109 [Symbiodinium microadriaticum]CAE7359841.1 unnamed protein product [Symbiodinium sp. KB8]CAE7872941.1 unnamed protein product [Symbiodinium microadriaticum]